MSQGSMNDGANATWLPNLIGGTSIWKLAVDLNEAKFFDGRLLVPETEGSESLPVTVRWDLSGLQPLAEARAADPAGTTAAIADFQAALARVAKVFGTPNSGYDKYKAAFTVPSVDADNGANYFYAPSQRKLFVINWGASPRLVGGRTELVFGYEDWGKAFDARAAGAALAPSVSALEARAPAAAAAAPEPKKDEKKDEPKKDDGKKRPWWMWPLFALVAIILVLLALFLLKACNDESKANGADGGEAGAEAGLDGAADAMVSADADADANAEADAGADADATADAAGDAGADAMAEAGHDGGHDGGTADDDDDDDSPGGSSGGSSGGGGGTVKITMGGAPGGNSPAAKQGPHRRHFQADAQKWRIAAGNDKVTRTEAKGTRFDVWLAPQKTFQGVGVEWQDKAGKWHAH